MKRYALWALLILAAWWVIQDPTSAAHLVHALGRGISPRRALAIDPGQQQLTALGVNRHELVC